MRTDQSIAHTNLPRSIKVENVHPQKSHSNLTGKTKTAKLERYLLNGKNKKEPQDTRFPNFISLKVVPCL